MSYGQCVPSPTSAEPGWVERTLPGLWQLIHYHRGWLRGDLLAGVTVAAYLIPQVMAYAEVAGLPAVTGLWAVVGPLVIYSLVGSSSQLSVGPESSTALMTAVAVGTLAGSSGRAPTDAAAALAIAVGVVCVVGWIARLGFLANLLSRPVLVGYMAGIAVLMVVSQLGKLTGMKIEGDSTLAELRFAAMHLDQVHPPTLILAGATLVLLFVSRRFLPRSPGPLIAMLLGAGVVFLFDLDRLGIAVVGPVPRGLPAPAIPDFNGIDLGTLLAAALGVSVVAYTDNVVTARAFATKRRETIDNRQEFLALGASNIAAGMLHGFPVSSSGSRTAIGDAMGSRSQLYSLVSLATVLITTFFLGSVLAAFPMAALGAVVVYAAIRLVDVGELRRFARFRRSELVLALATTTAVLVLDVLYGIAVAVALSILDLLRRIAKPHDGILGYVPGLAGMHDVDDYAAAHQVPGLVVYRYDSPLFFANAENFRHRALAAVDEAESSAEWFLLNAEANVEVDLTAIDALDELRQTLAERGITFAMARVKQDLRDSLNAAGFVEKVGENLIFMTLPTAVAAYVDAYTARHGQAPRGVVIPPVPPTSSGS
jgi:sulfate permease, SulP family